MALAIPPTAPPTTPPAYREVTVSTVKQVCSSGRMGMEAPPPWSSSKEIGGSVAPRR
jgi:hypothetical protein